MNTQTITLTPPIDGVQYGISETEVKDNQLSLFYNTRLNILQNCVKTDGDKRYYSDNEFEFDGNTKQILFSTKPKDTRFPFLVMPSKEQEVKKLAKETTKNEPIQVMPHLQHYFIIGFNANKGVYTQEQMEKAFIAGRNSIFSSKSPTGIIEQQEYIQSLQPTAKAVRVEMEENNCDGCKAGIPVDEYNYHRMGKGIYPDFMICQKDKYNKIKVETSSEYSQGIVRVIEVIY